METDSKNQIKRLDELKKGQIGIISKLSPNIRTTIRLWSMGIKSGSQIEVMQTFPSYIIRIKDFYDFAVGRDISTSMLIYNIQKPKSS